MIGTSIYDPLQSISLRKRELIRRDPLGKEFERAFKRWFADRQNLELTENIFELIRKIREKWHLNLYIPSSTWDGITDCWVATGKTYPAVELGRRPDWLFDSHEKVTGVHPFFNKDFLIWCEPHKIAILIDPTSITVNDAKKIKTAIWNIIKNKLKKVQNEGGTWVPEAPEGEPPELASIFRCRDNTFKKYLRWYDLKIEGLPFRLIAIIENNKNPDEVATIVKQKARLPRFGGRVRGESNVRQGFNKIYQAIYRSQPPSQENEIETIGKYKCPEHEEECTWDCSYLKEWMARFDRTS